MWYSRFASVLAIVLFHSYHPFRAQLTALYNLGLKPQALRSGPSRTLSPLNYILYSKSLKTPLSQLILNKMVIIERLYN